MHDHYAFLILYSAPIRIIHLDVDVFPLFLLNMIPTTTLMLPSQPYMVSAVAGTGLS